MSHEAGRAGGQDCGAYLRYPCSLDTYKRLQEAPRDYCESSFCFLCGDLHRVQMIDWSIGFDALAEAEVAYIVFRGYNSPSSFLVLSGVQAGPSLGAVQRGLAVR
jgi:hypothetical protein